MAETINEILQLYETKAAASDKLDDRGESLFNAYKELIEKKIQEESSSAEDIIEYIRITCPNGAIPSEEDVICAKPLDVLLELRDRYFPPAPAVVFHMPEAEQKQDTSGKKPYKPSLCTIRMLSIAADITYLLGKDNLVNMEESEANKKAMITMAQHGYAITQPLAPLTAQGTGTTRLCAMVIEPQDSESPIVICYRGTEDWRDVLSDLNLTATGTVGKELRDAAFEFYSAVHRANPNRQIILVGHSLGGHLAQYVGARAYDTDRTLLEKPLIQVRTFNTAPGKTEHSKIFQQFPKLPSQFINYRLNKDVVSNLPLQDYQGSVFDYLSPKGKLAAHFIASIQEYLPTEVMDLVVGRSAEANNYQGLLLELFHGTLNSYRCRIHSKTFSSQGKKNLEVFESHFPEMIADIKKFKYDDAIEKLLACRELVIGDVSAKTIEILLKSLGEMGILKNRLMKMCDILRKDKIDGDSLNDDNRAKILYLYCQLEPDPAKVVSFLKEKNFAEIMINNLDRLDYDDLKRAELIIGTLYDHECKSLADKVEEIANASNLVKLTLMAKQGVTSNYLKQEKQHLSRLRLGKNFRDSATIDDQFKDAKNGLKFKENSGMFKLFNAVLTLQKEKEKQVLHAATPSVSVPSQIR